MYIFHQKPSGNPNLPMFLPPVAARTCLDTPAPDRTLSLSRSSVPFPAAAGPGCWRPPKPIQQRRTAPPGKRREERGAMGTSGENVEKVYCFCLLCFRFFSGFFGSLFEAEESDFLKFLDSESFGNWEDKNMVGKWWMCVGQEPRQKKLPSGNLMSPYEGFFGDVRCESLFPFESMLSCWGLGDHCGHWLTEASHFSGLEMQSPNIYCLKTQRRPCCDGCSFSDFDHSHLGLQRPKREKPRHGFWEKKTSLSEGLGDSKYPQPSSATEAPGIVIIQPLELAGLGGMAIACCLWEGARKCPFGTHFGGQVSSFGLIPEARCAVSIFVRVLAEGFATQESSPIPILHIRLLMYCNNLHSCTIIPIISHQYPN